MPKKQSDDALLGPSFLTGGADAAAIARALKEGSGEVRRLLGKECSLILECRLCRNLFRSLINFIAHKRSYCRGQAAQLAASQGMNPGALGDMEEELHVIAGEVGADRTPSPAPSDDVRPGRARMRTNPVLRLTRILQDSQQGEPALPTTSRQQRRTVIENGVQKVVSVTSRESEESEKVVVVQSKSAEKVEEKGGRERRGGHGMRLRSEPLEEGGSRSLDVEQLGLVNRLTLATDQIILSRFQCKDTDCLYKGIQPFSSLELLAYHVSYQHRKPKGYHCLLCEESAVMKTKANLHGHLETEHASLASLHSSAMNSRRVRGASVPSKTPISSPPLTRQRSRTGTRSGSGQPPTSPRVSISATSAPGHPAWKGSQRRHRSGDVQSRTRVPSSPATPATPSKPTERKLVASEVKAEKARLQRKRRMEPDPSVPAKFTTSSPELNGMEAVEIDVCLRKEDLHDLLPSPPTKAQKESGTSKAGEMAHGRTIWDSFEKTSGPESRNRTEAVVKKGKEMPETERSVGGRSDSVEPSSGSRTPSLMADSGTSAASSTSLVSNLSMEAVAFIEKAVKKLTSHPPSQENAQPLSESKAKALPTSFSELTNAIVRQSVEQKLQQEQNEEALRVQVLNSVLMKCKLCDVVFPRLSEARRHVMNHLDIARFRCLCCGAAAFFVLDVKNHLRGGYCQVWKAVKGVATEKEVEERIGLVTETSNGRNVINVSSRKDPSLGIGYRLILSSEFPAGRVTRSTVPELLPQFIRTRIKLEAQSKGSFPHLFSPPTRPFDPFKLDA